MKRNRELARIEERFKSATGIVGDLSSFPLKKANNLQFATNRNKSREYAEVFTPLHIVDEMIQAVPATATQLAKMKTLDLCAGHGQFTIRILKKLSQTPGFDVRKHLLENHFFAELQTESCLKLLWIFGQGTYSRPPRINLAIGNALQLGKLPRDWRGIWLWLEALDGWVPVTGVVHAIIPDGWPPDDLAYSLDDEAKFVKVFDAFVSRLNRVCKEPKMDIKQIAATKEGRKFLSGMIKEVAGSIEQNWQNVETPDDIVRDMVRCVPDIKDIKKMLVLFNIEYVEYLVKDMDIDPSRIDFGSDSLIRSEQAKNIYGVHAFSIGKNFEEMKAALDGKGGQYDVVFSNPPYQEMDGGFGVSAKPLYHKIVEYAIDVLRPRFVCMITPSRWMAGGKGLDQYRERMLKDKRLCLIQDFPGNCGMFESVAIGGGVSYFLWDREYNGQCKFNDIQRDIGEFDVLVRDNTACLILKKILGKHDGGFCDKKVLPRKPFGLPTNFSGWVTERTQGAIKCYCTIRDGFEKWVAADAFKDAHGVQNKWKVMAGAALYEGASFAGGEQRVFQKTFVAEKGSICIETYLVTGSFASKKEAENYLVYMRTKFYRFMVSLRAISQNLSMEKFAWVPDLGDYSKAWTDEELYAHFDLTKKEREHIEKSIKALE